jgi:hypothetical protein
LPPSDGPVDLLKEQIVDELDNRIEEARFEELIQLAQSSLTTGGQAVTNGDVEMAAPAAATATTAAVAMNVVAEEEEEQYAALADEDLEEEDLVHEGLGGGGGGRDAGGREIDEVDD